jgi:hypothetical protein
MVVRAGSVQRGQRRLADHAHGLARVRMTRRQSLRIGPLGADQQAADVRRRGGGRECTRDHAGACAEQRMREHGACRGVGDAAQEIGIVGDALVLHAGARARAGRLHRAGQRAVLAQQREQLARHVRAQFGDAAAMQAHPLAVRAGQHVATIAGLGARQVQRAEQLGLLAAHHVDVATRASPQAVARDDEPASIRRRIRHAHQLASEVGQRRLAFEVRHGLPADGRTHHARHDDGQRRLGLGPRRDQGLQRGAEASPASQRALAVRTLGDQLAAGGHQRGAPMGGAPVDADECRSHVRHCDRGQARLAPIFFAMPS